MINIWEVNETNKMVEQENLDVRTITIGISLLECIDSDLKKLNENIYNRITTVAKDLAAVGEKIENEYGIPIVNKRISVTPIALVGGAACKTPEDFATIADTLDRAAKAAFEAGWNRMKLYFMMGLPGERDEDIVAIANLADHVLELGRSVVPKARRGSISVSISVSVFIPKAATPFQWCPQLDYDDVKRRQKLLITSVRNRAVRVHYHDAETSLIEAALSRAGRDMTPVIIDAWRSGSRFDAWVEHFSLDNWKEAAAKNGIDLNELVHLPYELDWRLPWEHVSPGCTRGFLEREYRRSLEGVTTPDCTRTSCTGCGICPTLHAKNVLMGDRA